MIHAPACLTALGNLNTTGVCRFASELGDFCIGAADAERCAGWSGSNQLFRRKKMTRMIKILCVALLTIVGLVGSSVPARADDKCDRDIHRAEDKLRDAVAKHGEHSRSEEHT